MPKFVQVALSGVLGYGVGALVGYLLVSWLSPNRHDRDLEAAMTSLFVVGPLGALVLGAIAYLRLGR